MCKCTDLTHEDVRRLIKAQELKSMPAVMQELAGSTSCGCHVCRPALNFYLLADWPDDYQDDAQSRFINERAHANIQKDGTFSVVPRMWGGVTTPAELRAIADAAEKYDVPMVKVTGGQRIDLLGVRKEDLPAMWADLNAAGLVSGHAYSKGLRTVKTCVGSEFCRFGTQDSTGLGIRLEKRLWGSWTPHKVKIGVSGCPRNCAEATCKDVGVVCVDSRLPDRRRRRGRHGREGDRAPRHGRDRGGGDRDRRRLRPALPRERQVPRPPLQVDREGRPRLGRARRSWTTSTAAPRSSPASTTASASTSATPGPSAPRAARPTSSPPLADLRVTEAAA